MKPQNLSAPKSLPIQEQSKFDVVVLGAGMTGLTLAHDLSAQGLSVALIDAYQHAGGNHISDEIDGMTFDIGAIFHWSDNSLFKMFPSLKQHAVQVDWRTDRVNPDGHVVAYPFDIKAELLNKPIPHIVRVLMSMVKNRLFPPRKDSAQSFLFRYLGKMLTKSSGIERFVERFYGLSAQDVSYAFAEARMGQIVSGTSIRHRIAYTLSRMRQSRRPDDTRVQCLARPKEGFAAFYAGAIRQLEEAGVKPFLGCDIAQIRKTGDQFELKSDGGSITSDRVFSTIPLAKTLEKIDIEPAALPTSLDLYSLYFKFKGTLGFKGPILYNFHDEGRWKRITLHSQYYGDVDGWSYFTVETTLHKADDWDVDTCEADFLESIKSLEILDGTVELVGYRKTDFAYPLYERGVTEQRSEILKKISAFGIESAGRQGGFEYLPVTQYAIMRAREALARSEGS